MSLSMLDPSSALIVVDVQAATLGLPTISPAEELVKNAAALAERFRARTLPVVLVNVAGGAPGRTERPGVSGRFPDEWTTLAAELSPSTSDHMVTKETWDAFHRTDLDLFLRERGTTQVVICGIATSIGVESTARSAFAYGFSVAVVADAVTDVDRDAHGNSLERIFPQLGETGTTSEIAGLLA
jgi:nicotinamidase-related amidase